jgi:hypothetical protein
MDVWKLITEFAAQRDCEFETALLGDVPHYIKDGHSISIIPPWVEKAAKDHGFLVVAADWKRDVYVLRKVGDGTTANPA